MAIDNPMNDDEENEEAKPKKKSGLLKILVLILTALLLVGASVGATLFFTGALHGDPAAADEGAAKDKKKESKKAGDKASKGPPLYVQLGDAFVVNFVEANQIRYLQVKVELMTRDATVAEQVANHLPLIRNNLIMMFSGLDYQTISTATGKQKIRDEALAEVQNILKTETGKPGIDALYFTSFVMQ